MTRTKYPATERVTAGQIAVGDSILIRERRADLLDLALDPDEQTAREDLWRTAWQRRNDDPAASDAAHAELESGRFRLQPGTYRVTDITSALTGGPRRRGSRRSRVYDLTVCELEQPDSDRLTVRVSFAQRLNRITA